jgi:hypothetical protein
MRDVIMRLRFKRKVASNARTPRPERSDPPGFGGAGCGEFFKARVLRFLGVKENAQTELPRHCDGRVSGQSIDDNTLLDDAGRNFAKGSLQGLAGVVGWDDDHDLWRWHLGANHFPAGDQFPIVIVLDGK